MGGGTMPFGRGREKDRLDIHHHLDMMALSGRLYLAPLGKDIHRVLDLGTGTGIWAMEMGMSLPPYSCEIRVPPNVAFQVDDIEDDWTYEAPFDYIHSRYLACAISDWPRNTKPGGWVEFQDFDFKYYSVDGSLKDDMPLTKWDNLMIEASIASGREGCPGPRLKGFIEDAGFENVTEEVFPFPIGMWPKDKKLKEMGAYNLFQRLEGLEGITLGLFTRFLGWSREEILVFLTDVRKDLKNPKIHPCYNLLPPTATTAEGQTMADAGQNKTSSGLRVLVIGAGITGLLVAQGLKKVGVDHIVFESEPSAAHYRAREWSIGMHWSLPSLERILPVDLWDRLREAQNDPFYESPPEDVFPLLNSQTGEILKNMPLPKTVRVSRRKMRALCSEGVVVKYDKTLTGISYEPSGTGVTATFSDGTTAHGTTLIGSDGPRSKVRELLLGPEKAAATSLEIAHNNLVVEYGEAEKALFLRRIHPIFYCGFHPKGYTTFVSIQDVPDNSKPEIWRFQIVVSWLGTRDPTLDDASRLSLLKKLAESMADPFRSAIMWIPDGTPVPGNDISYWVTIPWNSRGGRATLAGDAAHPLPPHRGQGLNHCVGDVSHLVDALKKVQDGESELAEAVAGYEEEMIKRGAKEVESSFQNAMMVHDWGRLSESPLLKNSLGKG
ncbi:hypothetical protein FGG08_004850 [Glutinoglossum americanum]|uniref:FAD-binding domain-containing protein n=1 Tax=Glutinoglossum americanum TaxID=1670608 RepID=A0A9P8L2B6_9PEZI|nr:hypothetical protein FGG08_004850 [Glutinoglossum americanum]